MAIGIVKPNTIVGLEEESTQGTYVAPSATTSYVQVLDGLEVTQTKETVERAIITNTLAKATPRVGKRASGVSLPVEFRASGTEGEEPDFHSLLHGALGGERAIAAQVTTKASGNTGVELQIEDADIGDFTVGDIIVVLESGEHRMNVVTGVDTTGGAAHIDVSPGRAAGSYSNSVVISKTKMYFGADTGHPSLSASVYWGDEIVQTAFGCMVSNMSLEGYVPGGIASWAFGLEGMNFDETDGSAPHTPAYDSALPPVILNACIFQDGTQIEVNEFSLSVENSLGFLETTCSTTGRAAVRQAGRSISGSLNVYKDDTSVDQYTKFDANTEFELLITAYTPSSTSGEIELGSAVGIYLPKCIITNKPVGEVDGVLTDQLEIMATGGTVGGDTDIFIGLI